MTGPTPSNEPQTKRIIAIRSGTFSGSATSIVGALSEIATVVDIDVMPYTREVASLPWRLIAHLEAARVSSVAWTKTATWAARVQARLQQEQSLGPETPLVFIQSMHGCVLDEDVNYLVYTDRVGLEGAGIGGAFRSRFSEGWLKRETKFLRGARRVLVMGPSTKQVLIERYGLRADQVKVVGAGPNCSLGSQIEATSCRTFLFVGTQWDLKGGPTLLAAFKRLHEDRPETKLLLVGGFHPESLPTGVRAVGRIPHDQMDNVYSQADAFVVPTHMEAFGISLMEALIKGLPSIGTHVGNQAYLMSDAGICVNPGDIEALEGAMRQVIDSYDAFASKAKMRGVALATEMDWRRIARQMIDEFEGI